MARGERLSDRSVIFCFRGAYHLRKSRPFIKLFFLYKRNDERFKKTKIHKIDRIFINNETMNLSNNLIENIIRKVAGEETIPLYRALRNKKNVSEFLLATKLKEEINTVRNKLYRLYHANLVTFTRKKDKQKGWYIYYWTFNNKRISFLMHDLKRELYEKLTEQARKEKNNHFFMCKNKCMRLTFDRSVDFNYKCPECGGLMEQVDNAEKIRGLEKEIGQLRREIEKKKSRTEKKEKKQEAVSKKKQKKRR